MSTSTNPIENVIVVMLENRSYDNMLGGLYLPTNPAPYNQAPLGQNNLNGLNGSESNPISTPTTPLPNIPVHNQTAWTQIGGTGTYYPPTTIPLIDPGEAFSDMAWQITGSQQTANPYGPPWTPPLTAMQGFVDDYANLTPSDFVVQPTSANVPDVMNYFTPDQVPVTAWLANNFAVCDQWFASAPCQTFTNRAFTHCAAPAIIPAGNDSFSLVDDEQYGFPVTDFAALPSIFSVLDAAYPDSASGSPPNWKVYFHDYSISILTVPYVYNAANSTSNVNVATYDHTDWGKATPSPIMDLLTLSQSKLGAVPSTFMHDLTNGTLPMYSFIEPRYAYGVAPHAYPPNSNHPGGSLSCPPEPVSPTNPVSPPIDVADGEAFLRQLYDALYQSKYWEKTLLIITYDEHGGLYDHVPPPSATSPGQTQIPPSMTIPAAQGTELDSNDDDNVANGFQFNVFGCRVPTLIVSPYIAPGTQISPPQGSAPFDHTSIIRTVWDIFITNGNPTTQPSGSSLTDRDAAAPSLYPFLNFINNDNPGNNPGPY